MGGVRLIVGMHIGFKGSKFNFNFNQLVLGLLSRNKFGLCISVVVVFDREESVYEVIALFKFVFLIFVLLLRTYRF